MAERARTGWRSATGAAALLLALVSGAGAQERAPGGVAAASDEALARAAACRVILVVEQVETEPKHFSGMGGPTFWLRIREVIRFEADPVTVRHPADAENYRALRRARAEGQLLEWEFLYPLDDGAERREAEAVARAIEGRGRFLLATATVDWFSPTGTLRPGKWARLGGPAEVVVPIADGVLERLRARIAADPDRRLPVAAPSAPPAPPATPIPGGLETGGEAGGPPR